MNYKKAYHILYNAITKDIDAKLEQQKNLIVHQQSLETSLNLLKQAQIETEEMFLQDGDTLTIVDLNNPSK